MSVDIGWETLTQGPDGAVLAETIRGFVHERFQQIPLPHLIRSVKCHSFEFGSVAPQIVLKDICDPLPDFYEDEDGDEGDADAHGEIPAATPTRQPSNIGALNRDAGNMRTAKRAVNADFHDDTTSSILSGNTTPGVLRGPLNMGYFHLPLSAGLSGTNTPLAAVAGARYSNGPRNDEAVHHQTESFSSISPPSTATPPSRPQSQRQDYFDQRHSSAISDDVPVPDPAELPPQYEPSPNDLQVVFHVVYAGDIRLSLTADVFLDYPMPSFVGIPLKLNITGLRFDGVGIVAYIKKKTHLCFLSAEDAEALVGGESAVESPQDYRQVDSGPKSFKAGGLIEEIKIESEIGETDNGKQVLKNVGKIEKFILEKVQQIFEDEFVYPSFWTFLV